MNKPLVAISAGAAVFALSASFAILGLTEVLGQHTKSDHSDWMAACADGTEIRHMAIPGSHDSLALYGLGDFAGQCQSLSVEEQLKAGIRFFDIRLKEASGSLRAVHGIVDQKQSFKDTAAAMEGFLKNHQKETLFVSIKDEAGGNPETFELCLKTYIAEDSPWYLDATMPTTLGQARGKIVLLSRYANSTIGIPCAAGWQDNATFDFGEFHVQDEYKVEDINKKKAAIGACYAHDATYKINFLSGYYVSSFPPSYALNVAREINPWISTYYPTMASTQHGFTVFDFVTGQLMDDFFEATK